mgnify:CR=1 FL=1
MDMIVRLYDMPAAPEAEGVTVRRALSPDYETIRAFVREHFSEGWYSECGAALTGPRSTCFIAMKDGELIGFACYDTTAKGYFGPIGVREDRRGGGTGAALLLACLHAMREDGYGYAVIGWCDGAREFYRKIAGAMEIPGTEPEHTVYSRLIRLAGQ